MNFEILFLLFIILVCLVIFYLTLRPIKNFPKKQKPVSAGTKDKIHDPLKDNIIDMHERLTEIQQRKFAIPSVEQRTPPVSAKQIASSRQKFLKRIKSNGSKGKKV